MTREDMQIIVDHYLKGASAKSVLESEDIQASSREVTRFLQEVARFVEDGIGVGSFDE
jgi:hypothetical protein